MKPEIFRRCASCGASFRSGALFCPQCGESINEAQRKQETESASQAAASDEDFAKTNVNVGMATVVDFEPTPSEEPIDEPVNLDETISISNEEPAEAPANLNDTIPIANTPSQTQRIPEATQPLHPTQSASGRRRRPNPGSGNIERRIRPGVEKLRKGTSIVIDEASYDPSLRFVLIAGILFLLFLVLLILSKWLG